MTGWHRSRIGGTGARPGGSALAPRVVARWLLLGAVIAAVFGLHVLTVDHGDHGDLPMVATVGHSATQPADGAEVAIAVIVSPTATAVLDMDSPIVPSDHGDSWLAGCVLFLVVAGSGALPLLASIRRRIGDPQLPGLVSLPTGSWSAPAPLVPRLALGVIRI